VTNRSAANRTVGTPTYPTIADDGTFRIASFELPITDQFDVETRAIVQEWLKTCGQILSGCPGHYTDPKAIPAVREYLDRRFFPSLLARTKALYDVRIEPQDIKGVYTEIFTPAGGVARERVDQVLINLHGGGFTHGGRWGGQIEAIPVAALSKTKVISVDYRMAPEHQFPAATDDVVKVYATLLEQYLPKNIGIFGCSAGAVLTAQTVARLLRDQLPLPGAVGMFCAGADYWAHGDSTHLGAARFGQRSTPFHEHPYFENANPNDPLVAPLRSPEVLARFPRSLLIASTRDHVLSGVVHTHSRLVALGVDADLHVWEGLDHAFYQNPDLPQSRELHDVTVRFFARHLGR
jgi:epsilon-lactone hydrolase